MKKNKSMRLAGGLMIATMLSTSIVSGTYAKYVTSDNAEDSARVAKFGVTVTASGSLFDKTYMSVGGGNTPGGITADTDNTTLTVESSNDNKLVAPGTKNTEGITFAIAGTPEVDVKLDVVVDEVKEVFLNAKTDLPDMTTGDAEDTFDNTADYYPVKFTLTQTKTTAEGKVTTNLVTAGTLAKVEEEIEKLSNNSIDANTDLAGAIGTLKLTWEWDFDASGAGTYDKQDTLLGDLAVDKTLIDSSLYSLDESIKISISVTQVD